MRIRYINDDFFSFLTRASLSKLCDHTQNTPHSVRLLWTSDRPDAEISTSQNTAHALGGAATGIGYKWQYLM